ncbi:hypothetical protein V6Z12_D06G096000 [Gossypium hirsutum]
MDEDSGGAPAKVRSYGGAWNGGARVGGYCCGGWRAVMLGLSD